MRTYVADKKWMKIFALSENARSASLLTRTSFSLRSSSKCACASSASFSFTTLFTLACGKPSLPASACALPAITTPKTFSSLDLSISLPVVTASRVSPSRVSAFFLCRAAFSQSVNRLRKQVTLLTSVGAFMDAIHFSHLFSSKLTCFSKLLCV